MNFVTPNDSKFLQETEKFYNTEIIEMPLDVNNILIDLLITLISLVNSLI